jgi:glyoxylase-like metal-dependent hydrolase (beta-lactamase superfamily II)
VADVATLVAPNPGAFTLEGTNTYVVGRDPAWVIDPGPDDGGHLDAVRAEAGRRGGVGGIVLTHGHADHSAGVAALGTAEPTAGVAQVGPFEVLPTPGHAPDHVCLLLGDLCFCGDLVLGHGSSFVPPDPGALAATLRSLARLSERAPSRLLCGHGPPVDDPQARIAQYIDHRLERERALVAALDRGVRARRELLDAAWNDVPEEMRPAADIVMEAHLLKLGDEDRLPHDVEPIDPTLVEGARSAERGT